VKINKIFIYYILSLFALLNFSYAKDSNRVAIVVNRYLKEVIEENLNIYLQDLKNEGYEPILKEWDLENDPAPQALKAYLQGLYSEESSLQGAVFIGDLPIPIMEADPVLKGIAPHEISFIQISDGYIAEQYYMDLVGKEWVDNNGNYKFEEPDYESYWESFLKTVEYYTPDMLKQIISRESLYPIPEIWTSRIVTSTLTGLFKQSEAELVNAYLVKNHAYRTGEVVFSNQTLLYSLPFIMVGDGAFSENRFMQARHILSKSFVLQEPIPAPETIDEFFKPLKNESYEILYWGRHGMKTYIDLGRQLLTSHILAETPINVATAFVFPFSCWIGHYTENAYFGGSFLFNERYYALGMLTATLPIYGDPSTSVMSEFIDGGNLGASFKKKIETPDVLSFSFSLKRLASDIASLNSSFILGDGTLKLQSKELVANKNNLPQNYLIEKYPYNEESIYRYVRSEGSNAEELDDVSRVNALFKIAFEKNDYIMIKNLLEKGVDVMSEDEMGNTLLHLAAADKKEDFIIGLLIKSGLDMRVKNIMGKTPWDIAKDNGYDIKLFSAAIEYGTIELIKFLLENGANVNAKNKDSFDDTPLRVAVVRRDDIEIIKVLLEHGADVNATSNGKSTPLIVSNNGEVIKLLIEHGADVNAKYDEGFTPLHFASVNGQIEIVKILIENGADVNVKNDFGQTPKNMAWDPEVLELLKNAEAKTKSEL